MKKETLLLFAAQLRSTLGLPVRVFDQEEMIACHELSETNPLINGAIVLSVLQSISQHSSEHVFTMAFSDGFIVAGIIICVGTPYRVILGPVRTEVLDDEHVFRMLSAFSMPQAGLAFTVYQYLKMQSVMNQEQFVDMLNLVNMAMNRDTAAIVFAADDPGMEKRRKTPILRVSQWAEEQDMKAYWEGQRKILYLIRHGMTAELNSILTGAAGKIGDQRMHAYQNMRTFQDHNLMALETVCQNALSAGMDANLAYYISEQYVERIELAKSFAELNQIRFQMVMEYAERMKQMRLPETLSPLMLRVVSYIAEHIEEKITASVVAERFHISVPYLSSAFKKEMGVNFVDYVNGQKIEQAKQYLRYSDLSLSQISGKLSFATQGYFQKVFKDVTGTTPASYRSTKGNI